MNTVNFTWTTQNKHITINLHTMNANRLELFIDCFTFGFVFFGCQKWRVKMRGKKLIFIITPPSYTWNVFIWLSWKCCSSFTFMYTTHMVHTDAEYLQKKTLDRSLVFVILNNISKPSDCHQYYSMYFRLQPTKLWHHQQCIRGTNEYMDISWVWCKNFWFFFHC